MQINATEAAFEGFRISRRRPGVIAAWGGVWLLGLIAMLLAALPLVAPFMEELAAAGGDAARLSADATAALERTSLLLIPIAVVMQAVLGAAVYRAVLTPEAPRFAFLRLGRDEGRVLVAALVLGCISVLFNFGGEALVTWATAAGGMIAGAVVWLVVTGLMIWVSVRLCLAVPLTFVRERLAFAEAWKASRPLFWPLLGLNIVVLALAAIVVLLLVLIGWPLSVAMASGGPGTPIAAVGVLLTLLLMPLGMAMVSTLLWAPFAVIARDLPKP